jgi:hypothetical protein
MNEEPEEQAQHKPLSAGDLHRIVAQVHDVLDTLEDDAARRRALAAAAVLLLPGLAEQVLDTARKGNRS